MSTRQKVKPALGFSVLIDSFNKRRAADTCGNVNTKLFPEQEAAEKLDEVASITNCGTTIFY